MENQCQHLTTTQRNKLLKVLQIFEEFFDETLGNWKTDTVECELKYDIKPILLRPYPVPKVNKEKFKRRLDL